MSGAKHWSDYADNKLRAMYSKHSQAELEKTFPNRSWNAICQRARSLGLHRARKFAKPSKPTKDDLMAALRYAREQRNLPAYRLSEMIGLNPRIVSRCERGVGLPALATLNRWCAALGLELTVKPARSAHV